MTIAVDLGRKATKQTNKHTHTHTHTHTVVINNYCDVLNLFDLNKDKDKFVLPPQYIDYHRLPCS